MIIETTVGLIDDSELEKREGVIDNENEYSTWVEYWQHGVLVHRSASVGLKKGLDALGAVGSVG
jgi:hypothetical protein